MPICCATLEAHSHGGARGVILGGTPIGPGNFTLQLTLDRDRWLVSTGSDPEQHYHDQSAIPLHR
jgi:hypothetical protein